MLLLYFSTKSLYRSRAGRHFYGTENVIWAGFGPIGNTEKKSWAIMSNFLGWFFRVCGCKKFILKNVENVVASALKSCIEKR